MALAGLACAWQQWHTHIGEQPSQLLFWLLWSPLLLSKTEIEYPVVSKG